jgi:AhpD family alkylhydroperoxidase
MPDENPYALFLKEAPEVAAAFDGLIKALIARGGLDDKTRQLIYIAMKAAQGDTLAVQFHVPMAMNAGATREEIVDTILLTLTVAGVKGVMTCLPTAIEAYGSG